MFRFALLCLVLAATAAASPRVPLYLEPVSGDPARFHARGAGYTAVLASDGIEIRQDGSEVRLRFERARPNVLAEGRQPLEGVSNYLIGNLRSWRRGVPHYGRVQYREVWPGIDVVYYGAGARVEYDFVVAPGADPALVAIRAPRARIGADGTLEVDATTGRVLQTRPDVYQQVDGRRVSVRARYVRRGEALFGVELGDYCRDLPVVIDPVLSYSTYFGGDGTDVANGVAVDSGGNVYIAGQTTSTTFTGPFPAGGSGDAYVAKLNASGTALVYVTYVGGSGTDLVSGLVVDASGSAYIAGESNSPNLPVTAGVFRGTCCGVFVAKLNPAGNALTYSTFLGGGSATALAVDAAGSAFVTGYSTTGFPVTAGAYQRVYGGDRDAFAAKLTPAANGLVYATLLGGAGSDTGWSIAVDAAGAAYIAGSTESTAFPVTAGAFQTVLSGLRDAFAAKVSADGSSLVYSTFLGTALNDDARGVAVDGGGNAYVTGRTDSVSFPTVAGSYLPTMPSGFAPYGYAVKLNAAGSGLVYGTYLGSSGGSVDGPAAVAVDSGGSAYFTGSTETGEFPTTPNAFQTGRGGVQDAFVARLNSAGSLMLFATHLGGAGADFGRAIAVDTAGNAYVVGTTASTNFPVTGLVLQASKGVGQDAFVAKIDNSAQSCGYVLSASSQAFGAAAGSGTVAVTTAAGCAWFASSNSSWITVTAGVSRVGPGTVDFAVAANDSTSPRTGSLTIAGQTFTISQPGSACTYSILPGSLTVEADGGIGSIAVTAPTGCSWTAASNTAWLAVTLGATGSGNGTVRYSVAANTSAPRSGTMTIAGQTFTVSQGGLGCLYTIAPQSQNVGPEGTTGTLVVNAPAGCPWTASSNVLWVVLSGGNSGTGPGTVQYTIAVNTGAARSGTLSVAGQTFTINQSASTCAVALNPTVLTLPDTGGTFSTQVTAGSACSWTSSTSVPWITITSGSGTGSGTVSFSVPSNPSSAPRTGFVVIGGQALVVTQNAPGQTTCGFVLSATNLIASQSGQTGAISLSAASPACQWNAVSNSPSLQLFPVSGSGAATISYTLYPNYTTSSRTLTAVIAGLTLTILQPGSTLSPDERFVSQMYFNFFGRVASPGEVAFQTSALLSGAPRGALVQNFFNSEEFNRSGRFIAGLYVGLLVRDAEYGGWLFQRNAFATGVGQQETYVAAFLGSPEYALRFGVQSNADFVTTLYRNVLLREPGPGEVDAQSLALAAGVTRQQLASAFLNSPEFRLGTGPRLSAFLLHAVLLMRGPSASELSARAAQVQAGTPLRALIEDFIATAEFAQLLQ